MPRLEHLKMTLKEAGDPHNRAAVVLALRDAAERDP